MVEALARRPELERINPTLSPHLVFLPVIDEMEKSFLPRAWPYFDTDRLRKNLDVILSIQASDLPGSLRSPFIFRRELLFYTYDAYQRYLPRIKTESYKPEYSIAEFHKDLTILNGGTASIDQVANLTDSLLREEKKPCFFLANSHAATYAELAALGRTDLGLIVFDHHADFYVREQEEEGIHKKTCLPDIRKSNFLIHALLDNRVNAVSVIGLPWKNKVDIMDSVDETGVLGATSRFYNENKKSILLEHLPDSDVPFDKTRFFENIYQQMEFLQKAGVKNIIFSFDVDVLDSQRSGYTTAEYNLLSALVSLGVQDLSKIEPKGIVKFILALTGKLQSSIAQAAMPALYCTLYPVDGLTIEPYGDFNVKSDEGLSLSSIGKAIDIIKNTSSGCGIEIGIGLPQGGRYFGDFAEISGVDYRRRTAKAISAIINRVLRDT